uniref:Uncharacterized protein n=1 Tax=Anguilla anguilla TaxID=7936 RepID=A0A0E9VTD8_ANGAN
MPIHMMDWTHLCFK